MKFKKNRDKLHFVALGGAEQIGMNLYLYHFNGKWIVVDMGIGFADEFFPGVDIVVPDISFLLEVKKDIVGIVLTHAHEDHIGAIPYLWNELKAPIYATKFTSIIVKAKLAEVGVNDTSFIKVVQENTKFDIADFQLEFIGITHSIPEMQGLYIKTPMGNIFHTGDWKLDENPVVGNDYNVKRLKEIAKEGVLAMICDSTNIFQEGRSGSEGDLAKSLTQLISARKKGMIVVTTFASNIARVCSIAQAALKSGRKVALAGRSLWRMTDAARQCGYLDDIPEFIKPGEIKRYKRDELLVIATGCQGEVRAAASKLANNAHPDFSLSPEDMVIFSSKIIPGNEKNIFPLYNMFARNQVHVMTENDHFVHVSGHPCREEVAQMYKLVKPKIAIPVHGEVVHTFEHVDFAKQQGVKEAFRIDNGEIVEFDGNSARIIEKVKSGENAIDGNFLLHRDSEILRMRRRMRDDGLVHATVIISSKGKLLKAPHFIAPGLLDSEEDGDYFDMMVEQVTNYVEDHGKKPLGELEGKVKGIIKRIVKDEINKYPKIVVDIHKLSI